MAGHRWIYPHWDVQNHWAFCAYCGLGRTVLNELGGCLGPRLQLKFSGRGAEQVSKGE
jgi:hypothetical protein